MKLNLVNRRVNSGPGIQQGRGQGGQLPPQILADQLTLSQPGGADYAHHSTTCPPGFLTLAASLTLIQKFANFKNSIYGQKISKGNCGVFNFPQNCLII